MLIKQKDKTNNSLFRVNIAAAVLTAGLVFSAVPASAYIPFDARVSIRVDPVELESKAGIQRVYDYMTSEAASACNMGGISLSDKRVEAKCTADLLSDFVFDLNDKRLIDYHKTQIST